MSEKTAIDLETLGAPSNDSEGINCYISEKGVQAAPISEYATQQGLGKYFGAMMLNGTAYHVFEKKVIDEHFNEVEFTLGQFSDVGGYKEKAGTREFENLFDDAKPWFEYSVRDIDPVDSKRPVKTISYMTLTKASLEFIRVQNNSRFIKQVDYNILCLFSCNIIAFVDGGEIPTGSDEAISAAESEFNSSKESKGKIIFIKNPVFATTEKDDVTEYSRLGIYEYRSYHPCMRFSSLLANPARMPGYAGQHQGMYLLEEDIILFDKKTRKILCMYQVSRYVHKASTYGDKPWIYIKETQTSAFLPGWNASDSMFDSPYEARFYVFGFNFELKYIEMPNKNIEEPYTHMWFNKDFEFLDTSFDGTGQLYKVTILGAAPNGDAAPSLPFNSYTSPHEYVATSIEALGHNPLIGIHVNTSQDDESDFGYVTSDTHTIDFFHERYLWSYVEYLQLLYEEEGESGEKIRKMVDIDRVMDYIDTEIKNSKKIKFYDSSVVESLRDLFHTYCFNVKKDPVINAKIGQYHFQDYLWGQRSRMFSLGTQVSGENFIIRGYANVDYSNDILEVSKFEGNYWIGTSEIPPTKFLDNRYSFVFEEGFKVQTWEWLRRNLLKSSGALYSDGDPDALTSIRVVEKDSAIFSMVPWELSDKTVEYLNAVYYTGIGTTRIDFQNNPYEVPSNISDKIIGIWGNDRNIYFISTKSIEQFNIADLEASPLSFVRLERVYDRLIDWSGINGRLDIIAADKGAIALNGVHRVKDIFSSNSRIAPDTLWKTTKLGVAENYDDSGNLIEYRVIDGSGREFWISGDAPVFALTVGNRSYSPYLATSNYIAKCEWENAKISNAQEPQYAVEWSYRNSRNILLQEICIRMSQHDHAIAEAKRLFRLRRDGNLIRERLTSWNTFSFHKIGRGLSSRLRLELSGYLKAVEMTDTEVQQK